MKGKFYHSSETINTNGHWAVGTEWGFISSKGGKMYNVEMQDKGFYCDCPAFKKCKHIKQVERGFDEENSPLCWIPW